MRGLLKVQSIRPKRVGGFLPRPEVKIKLLENIIDVLESMIAARDASPADVTSAYTKEVMAQWYIGSAPKGLVLGNNTCCHGAGVQVTTYRVYTMEKAPARSPEDFRNRHGHYPNVYMIQSGKSTQVAIMKGDRNEGLGRMGGPIGWDKTRDLFGFALASFRHNFQALLGAFADRPSLPCREPWHLPNLVCSEQVREIESRYGCKIVEPPIAIPPASYKFNFMAPTPAAVFVVGTNCPKETNAVLEFWTPSKQNFVDPLQITFPAGESETQLILQAPLGSAIQSGFFNVNPIDSEMTVSYVDVLFPPL